jgi:hypothetical protein
MSCFHFDLGSSIANKIKSIGWRTNRLFSFLDCLACLLLVFDACLCAQAQGTAQTSAAPQPEPTRLEQVPRVPGVSTLLRGFNAGVTLSGIHDSSIGWYNVATPAVSYTFSLHYSADASLSIYPYRLVQNRDPKASSGQELVPELGDAGDTFIGLHGSFNSRILSNTTTASFTIPTGDRAAGMGTGKVTFDFSDHLVRYFKQTGFMADIGAGDSSGLFNSMVTNNYTSLGPLAHLQQGIVVWLPGRNYIQSLAYEQLPFGKQTVYANPGPPNDPNHTAVSGINLGEDQGLTTSLGIPLTDHLTLSSYYSRSFSQHLDTVAVNITYVLRGVARKKKLSMIDRALREAAGDSP